MTAQHPRRRSNPNPRPKARVQVKPSGPHIRVPTSMTELAKNKRYVGLFQMADRLSAHFGISISQLTPYGWWKYTKLDTISLPMPNPRGIIRDKGGRPTPIWRWSEIVAWYSGFAGIVPPTLSSTLPTPLPPARPLKDQDPQP